MIPFFDCRPQLRELRAEIDAAIRRVLESGRLVLGPEVASFETEFADWVGSAGAVGVGSGTDALTLALRAVDISPGDDVLTVANAGVPPVAAIRAAGAVPRFVDVDPRTLLLDPDRVASAVGPRTRAVLPVHLYGRPAPMDAILAVADRHGLPVIEDCAQAHGARFGERSVGTFGRIGCFSFYPTKNLGALGDGGACVSDDPELIERLRKLRMYGFDGTRVSRLEGVNSRLDELQAAVLRVKLARVEDVLERRWTLARRYRDGLADRGVLLADTAAATRHAHHLFVIRVRERARVTEALDSRGIGHAVHYAVPVHRMPAYAFLGDREGALPQTEAACREVLSLPLFHGLDEESVDRVVEVVRSVT